MTENFYELFWQHGYKRLMVVSPHDDPMRYAGKRPAVRGPNGWYGVSVRTFEATPEQLPEWASWGGGVGLRCDRDHIGIDIDTMSAEWADKLKQIALEELGAIGARRIGRAPRTMLVYRVDETITYEQRRFDDGTEGGGLIELIAGETRWFVVHGVHPKTLVPYSWPDKVPRSEQLPVVTKAQLANFFARLDAELPKVAGKSNTLTDRAAVEQKALIVKDLSIVRQLLEKTPNLYEHTAYKELLELAVALRAVSQDDPETGEEIFLEFAERTDLEEQTENPLRVYRSLQPPFGFGLTYIMQFAHQRSDDPEQKPFQAAVAAFNYEDPDAFNARQAVEAAKPPAPAPAESEIAFAARLQLEAQVSPKALLRLIELTSLQDAAATALTASTKPLVKGLLDQGTLSVMYGPSNVGKTFVAMDIAFHIAAGLKWDGLKVSRGTVLYVAAEGGAGARKRSDALMRRYRAEGPGADFQLVLASLNLLDPKADLEPLIATIGAMGRPVSLVVLDTLSRVMAGGEENGSVDMTTMVMHFDKIRKATGAHVMVVHHSGKDQAKGSRGHSSLRAATDTEIEIAEGQIAVTKQRDLDRAFSTAFRLNVVTLGADEDGEPITSCTVDVVRQHVEPTSPATPTEQIVFDALGVLISTCDQPARGVKLADISSFLTEQQSGMSMDTVRAHLKNLAKKHMVKSPVRGSWASYEPQEIGISASSYSYFEPVSGAPPQSLMEENGRETGRSIFD